MTSAQIISALPQLSKRRADATVIALQLMLLLAAIDQTIISTAMPRIITRLGGFERYAWATTAYLLTSTISIPIFGSLSDRYGRKKLLSGGVLLFIAASVLCAVAGFQSSPSLPLLDAMNQFVGARAVQGLGAGIVLGLCFSVVADLFPAAERGRYQGNFAAVFAIASVVGPTLGGWVSDNFSWRWLFLMNVPVGLSALWIFERAYPADNKAPNPEKFDYIGLCLFIGAFVPLLCGLSLCPVLGWTSGIVLTTFGAALLGLGTFLTYEIRQKLPFMKVQLLFNRVVALSCISVFITGIGMFGSIMLLPIFFQSVLGMSAAHSGTLLTPLIITVAVTSIFGGRWMSNSKRYKKICVSGMSAITLGTLLLARIDAQTPLACTLAYMLVVGAGLGLLLPIYTIVIQNAVAEDDVGAVTGFSQFFRSVGGTTGVAVFGTIMLNLYEHGIEPLRTSLPEKAMALIHSPLDPLRLKSGLTQMALDQTQLNTTLNLVRQSLTGSIDVIFMLYGVLTGLTLIATFFLSELPLRVTKSNPNRIDKSRSVEY